MNLDRTAMEAERRCKYPGCNTLLRQGSANRYCDIHKELFEEDPEENRTGQDPKQNRNQIPGGPEFLTLSEAAPILHYSTRSLRKMIKERKILALRITKRGRWMIPKKEIERFEKEGLEKAQTSSSGLLSADEIKVHDIEIFRSGDSIMSEGQAKNLLMRLQHEQRYSATDFSMIFDILRYFHSRGNSYIDERLRNAQDKLRGGFEELISFMQLNFEILKHRGLFRDEIRILEYHPRVHGIERIKEYQEREKELKQVTGSAEVIYNEYRDTVKTVLGI